MSSTDIQSVLVAAADDSRHCQRVLRYHEGRHVCPQPMDFYEALRADSRVVVRVHGDLPGERDLPLDCRFRRSVVEFTHELRDVGFIARDQFLDDVRRAVEVEILHHDESQFDDGPDEPTAAVATDGGMDVVEDSYGSPVPAEVDGVDLKHDGCPIDGSETFDEFPAGHYHCTTCRSGWGGDPENASIETYFGPSPGDLAATGASLPVDIDGKCAACFVRPSEPDSRHCESCHDALAADGGMPDHGETDGEGGEDVTDGALVFGLSKTAGTVLYVSGLLLISLGVLVAEPRTELPVLAVGGVLIIVWAFAVSLAIVVPRRSDR